MEKTFNCHSNSALVVSNGLETHLLFFLQRPVIGQNNKGELKSQEQALITLPLDYARTFAESILNNVKEHEDKLRAKKDEAE
jgi:hypothetical protein